MTCAIPIEGPSPAANQDALAAEITLLAGQINAAQHRLLKLIARFDHCHGWSGGGTVRSCAHWLNWRCGIALGAAREKVRVARALSSLPLIDASFARGEISYSKVRAMTRVATPRNEDYLLMIARHGTASHLEQVVNQYRRVRRGMENAQEERQQEGRELVYYQDDNGMWIIHAKLPAEAGALVVKAIEAAVERERHDPLAQVSAETPAEASDGTENLLPDAEPTSFPQARADAMEQLAEHFLAASGDVAGLKGAERCQVQLHVSLSALQGVYHSGNQGSECCHLEGNHGISPDTARRLCCDASLVTVLEDDHGRVLNIGRRSRTVPPALRRALALRDRTCRVPGCFEQRYVDAHHVVHWADGGETSLDNLVTLCRHHHRALHSGAFSISAQGVGPERQFLFHRADGKVMQASVFPQFPGVSAETAGDELAALAPEVTSLTCISLWQGERCDYGMAIDGLLSRHA
jgi:hypothetical protein